MTGSWLHTCSYGCGNPTDDCGQPCPRCAADEAEQDAWIAAHPHLTPEERLLGAVQLSRQQAQRRRPRVANHRREALSFGCLRPVPLLLDQVADDAIRWAAAMQKAAQLVVDTDGS